MTIYDVQWCKGLAHFGEQMTGHWGRSLARLLEKLEAADSGVGTPA